MAFSIISKNKLLVTKQYYLRNASLVVITCGIQVSATAATLNNINIHHMMKILLKEMCHHFSIHSRNRKRQVDLNHD